jgi:hypothetical protein
MIINPSKAIALMQNLQGFSIDAHQHLWLYIRSPGMFGRPRLKLSPCCSGCSLRCLIALLRSRLRGDHKELMHIMTGQDRYLKIVDPAKGDH